MQRYLINQALKDVWCNPNQDNQVILKAQRLTKINGELNSFILMNRKVSLPARGKRYHVYQIGQVLPIVLGLKPSKLEWEPERWITFSEAMSSQKVLINLYNEDGVNIPRFNSYYMFSNDKNLIFAIEIDEVIEVNLETQPVYLRLYSNAYYQSERADAVTDLLKCNGIKANNVQHILDIQNEIAILRSAQGYVSCYVNGLKVDDIDPVTATIGDCIEYVYDSSVKRIVTYTVNTLKTFNSVLDNKYKYLLQYDDTDDQTIDYHDDMDVHVIQNLSSGRSKGIYYHRNSEDSHRMVTHRDYSIAVPYFEYFGNALSNLTDSPSLDLRDLKIEVLIRNSGYLRPLVYDNNRIFELYKLSAEKIQNAMTGVNATLDIWKAANLENCAYTRLMRSKFSDVNLPLVQDAYGYNSISKLIADTPTKTIPRYGRQSIDLPFGLTENSTAYEYDGNGYLIHTRLHPGGSVYNSVKDEARLVEVLSGKGSHRPDVRFGTDNIPVPLYDNYRVYMCFLHNDIPTNMWKDITDTPYYRIVDGNLLWNNLEYGQYLMIRTDSTFLSYDLDLVTVNGNLQFTLSEEENHGNGYLNHTMPVPMGQLDVFLNGRLMIQGLDYIVVFPKVHILNKMYLAQPAATEIQKVHVRFTGFCNFELNMEKPDDYGFIQHGFLSDNNRFDIRDDKVLSITVNGSVMHRSDLLFSEEHDGISILNPSNGKPYQIKDVIVPLKELVNENTYTLKARSEAIDTAVSNYLTVNLPEALRGNLMAIPYKYPLVSPFFSRIINALVDNEFPASVVQTPMSDNQLIDLLQPFEELLKFDPVNVENEYDLRFVQVLPHRNNTVITMTIEQYRLLVRIVKLFGNDRIELSPFVNFNS